MIWSLAIGVGASSILSHALLGFSSDLPFCCSVVIYLA
jgi:hypothetical protein